MLKQVLSKCYNKMRLYQEEESNYNWGFWKLIVILYQSLILKEKNEYKFFL